MFIEINEIKCFIFNIDGFFRYSDLPELPRDNVWSVIDDDIIDKVELLPELSQLIGVIKDKYPFRFVSKLSREQVAAICGINSFSINPGHVFTAADELEKGILFYEPMKNARDDMSMLSCYSVYITTERHTVDKALKLHMGTIVFLYSSGMPLEEETEIYKTGADFIIEQSKDLEEILAQKFVGHLSEVNACPDDMVPGGKRLIQFLEVPNKDVPNNKIFVGGRYLPLEDTRHNKHPLSIRLTDSKRHPERHAGVFSEILKYSADKVSDKKYDLITRVPPKPSQTSDRLKMFLERIPAEFKGFDKSKIAPDILRCLRDYSPQKEAGSYDNRKRNVEGAFEVVGDVKGKIVVVVDDVTTSGATLYESARILTQAGCKKVYPVAIALTVTGKATNGEAVLQCECGGKLVPRCGTTKGYVFWGCWNFGDKSKKHPPMNFSQGVKTLNERTSPPKREIPDDLDIPF